MGVPQESNDEKIFGKGGWRAREPRVAGRDRNPMIRNMRLGHGPTQPSINSKISASHAPETTPNQ